MKEAGPFSQTYEQDQIGKLIDSLLYVEQTELAAMLVAACVRNDCKRLLDKNLSFALGLEYVKMSGCGFGLIGLIGGIANGMKYGIEGGLKTFAAATVLGMLWGLLGIVWSRLGTPFLLKHSQTARNPVQVVEFQMALPPSEAFDECYRGLLSLRGMRMESSDRESGTLRGVTGFGLQSPGEIVGMEIISLSDNTSGVCVYSRPLSLFGLDFGRSKANVSFLAKVLEDAGHQRLQSTSNIPKSRVGKVFNSLSEFEQDELRIRLVVMHLRRFANWRNTFSIFVHLLMILMAVASILIPISWTFGGLRAASCMGLGVLEFALGAGIGVAFVASKVKSRKKDPLPSALQVHELRLGVSASQAFETCLAYISASGIRVQEVDRESRTLCAIMPMSWKSAGELVGVKIDQLVSSSQCGVRVYSRPLYIGAPDFGKHRSNILLLSKAIEEACVIA